MTNSKNNVIQRIKNSVKADILFQFKHGFYTIYVVLAFLYMIVLSFLGDNAKSIVLPILIYTDPSVLGMFFIGGIVLLEKEQGILSLLYITPLKVIEYIISKLLTLSIISLLAGLIITFVTYSGKVLFFQLIIGILLSSILFTLIGFIIATHSKTVNDYFVKVIPWMIIFIIPCLSLIPNTFIPKYIYYILNLIPSVATLKIVLGSFITAPPLEIVFCIVYTLITNIILLNYTQKLFTRKTILER